MLSNVLTQWKGVKMGEQSQMVWFLKKVFRSRPPKKVLVPDWDLPLVLQVLSATPFEPMKMVSLKMITFLLARRVSDVSRLSFGDHCRAQRGCVTFLPTSFTRADDPLHVQMKVRILIFKEKLFAQ